MPQATNCRPQRSRLDGAVGLPWGGLAPLWALRVGQRSHRHETLGGDTAYRGASHGAADRRL
eukprot:5786260-Alexandrium_andersonii.AAC.1